MRIRFDRVSCLQTGAIAALLLFSASVPTIAANTDTQAQVNRLQNELDTLSRAVFKGEQPPAGSISSGGDSSQADIQNRLSQMEMTLQKMTGKLEEQDHAIQSLREQLSRSGTTTTANTGNLPPASGGPIALPPSSQPMPLGTAPQPPAQTNTTTSTYTYSATPSAPGLASASDSAANEGFTMADPNAPAPANAPTAGKLGAMVTNIDQNGNATSVDANTPTGQYEAAYTLLKNQDYAGAQVAFDAFVKKYPDNTLVPNAKYWTGETYYVRNQFDQATRIFAETYQKYPKAPKAPDTLLKLGMSLAGQGKTKDACVALAQLKKQYPAGSAPVLTRGDQEIERLKCNAQ